MTCSQDEPIPIDKECSMCKQRKLLSEFDIAHKSSDNRTSLCKSCEQEKRETDSEFCCDGPGHTNQCLTDKTLEVMSCELDCFLARVQNGLRLTDFIRGIMIEIIKQDEINQRARDEINKETR